MLSHGALANKAEYRAVVTTASEMVWLTSLLREMLIPTADPPTIYYDNIGATYLCSNPRLSLKDEAHCH